MRRICISHRTLTIAHDQADIFHHPQTNTEMSAELEKQLRAAGLI